MQHLFSCDRHRLILSRTRSFSRSGCPPPAAATTDLACARSQRGQAGSSPPEYKSSVSLAVRMCASSRREYRPRRCSLTHSRNVSEGLEKEGPCRSPPKFGSERKLDRLDVR